jgi:hypothetical protein
MTTISSTQPSDARQGSIRSASLRQTMQAEMPLEALPGGSEAVAAFGRRRD